jgi:hypothetical protein
MKRKSKSQNRAREKEKFYFVGGRRGNVFSEQKKQNVAFGFFL